MTLFKRHIVPLVLWSFLVQPALAGALVVGQIDTFEDGTTQGWVINLLGIGSPPPAALPTNISTGGPGGAGDNYLQLTALGGLGAGGKLTVINATQWAGSYIGAGIGFIRMDVNNLGTNDVALRLWFEDPTVGPPSNVAVSTNAISVLAGSGWTSVTFPIQPGDLTAITGSATAALTNATDVRLFHSSSAAIPGPPIVAVLGVDNIEALAAPTPTPTDTPTESPTPVPTDTPTASPSSTPTITPTASSTATVTSTASPTLSGTPTETATPTPFPAPAITAGEAGSSVVTGRGVANPNPGNNCITIFDCGTDGICNGMGDDTPIGTGSIDPFGAFAVQVAPPLEAGQRIFARDTCNGLNGPPFVVVTAAAPALSGSMVIALVAILGTVGLAGLRRLPLGQ